MAAREREDARRIGDDCPRFKGTLSDCFVTREKYFALNTGVANPIDVRKPLSSDRAISLAHTHDVPARSTERGGNLMIP